MSAYRTAGERAEEPAPMRKSQPFKWPWWPSYALHFVAFVGGVYAELYREARHLADWSQGANVMLLISVAVLLAVRLFVKFVIIPGSL